MKAFRISLLATALIGVFTSASYADQVMELSIIKCGASGTPYGCGSNGPATDPLGQGYVQINNDRDVIVQLKGARSSTIYTVFVGNWVTRGGWQSQFSGGSACGAIGTVTTDGAGNFIGKISTSTGMAFAFPKGISIGQINFAFNNPSCYPTQFTTGISIP